MSRPSSDPLSGDLSGRNRLSRNLAFAWGGQLIVIMAGFIMPRLISDRLGQSMLGIWDFTWSVYSCFSLLQFGIGASAGRYVARHRARGDVFALSQSVSTLSLSYFISGWLILAATFISALWALPSLATSLGSHLPQAQWVLFFLGLEGSSLIMLGGFESVITGCSRWDLHNKVSASVNIATLIGMACALLCGGGLPSLAAIHCLIAIAGQLVRWRMARVVCPEVTIRFRSASMKVWIEQFRFSVKSILPSVADLFSNQALNLLIASHLGPSMLAVYARPRNLLRSLQVFPAKFGSILVPTSSSLQAATNHQALRDTLLASVRFLACLALPGIFTLLVFGDCVIRLWMGADYVYPGLFQVLAVGAFFTIVQEPAWSVLAGMNCHGRLSLLRLAGAVCSTLLVAVGLVFFQWTLLEASVAFVIPQIAIDGCVTPLYAARRLGIKASRMFMESVLRPLSCAVFYFASLLVARFCFSQQLWLALVVVAMGLTVLAGTLWRVIVPPARRQSLLSRFRRCAAPFGKPGQPSALSNRSR